MKNIIKTPLYGTGQFWYFDNGQFGEKTEIKRQDCYELQIINNKVTGLYRYQLNDNGQRLNSCCLSIYGLTGFNLEMYNQLINNTQS